MLTDHHHMHCNKHDFVMEGLLRYSIKNRILIKHTGLSLLLSHLTRTDLTDHK